MRGLTTIEYRSDVTVIRMQSLPCECWVCGDDATGLSFGIPVYEDWILPNDWVGEWGGVPACRECFEKQNQLIHTMTVQEFNKEQRAHRPLSNTPRITTSPDLSHELGLLHGASKGAAGVN